MYGTSFSGKKPWLAALALLAALSLAAIVSAVLHVTYWIWAVLALTALASCLTVLMTGRSALVARTAIASAFILAFTLAILFQPPPDIVVRSYLDTEDCKLPDTVLPVSNTLDAMDCTYEVVGTVKVNADCVSWAEVKITFYGPRYKVSGSTYVRQETEYQYYGRMYKGEIREFRVRFSGDFELKRYRITTRAMSDEKWCKEP